MILLKREDLVTEIANRMEMPKSVVRNLVKTYEDVIVDEIEHGGCVKLHGFMLIENKSVGEKRFVNPKTKEEQVIPAKEKIKIKAGCKFMKE